MTNKFKKLYKDLRDTLSKIQVEGRTRSNSDMNFGERLDKVLEDFERDIGDQKVKVRKLENQLKSVEAENTKLWKKSWGLQGRIAELKGELVGANRRVKEVEEKLKRVDKDFKGIDDWDDGTTLITESTARAAVDCLRIVVSGYVRVKPADEGVEEGKGQADNQSQASTVEIPIPNCRVKPEPEDEDMEEGQEAQDQNSPVIEEIIPISIKTEPVDIPLYHIPLKVEDSDYFDTNGPIAYFEPAMETTIKLEPECEENSMEIEIEFGAMKQEPVDYADYSLNQSLEDNGDDDMSMEESGSDDSFVVEGHRRVHVEGSKGFACTCGEFMLTKAGLKFHVLQQLRKVFLCPYKGCENESFQEAFQLKDHLVKVHERVTDFQYGCVLCGTLFNQFEEKRDHFCESTKIFNAACALPDEQH